MYPFLLMKDVSNRGYILVGLIFLTIKEVSWKVLLGIYEISLVSMFIAWRIYYESLKCHKDVCN